MPYTLEYGPIAYLMNIYQLLPLLLCFVQKCFLWTIIHLQTIICPSSHFFKSIVIKLRSIWSHKVSIIWLQIKVSLIVVIQIRFVLAIWIIRIEIVQSIYQFTFVADALLEINYGAKCFVLYVCKFITVLWYCTQIVFVRSVLQKRYRTINIDKCKNITQNQAYYLNIVGNIVERNELFQNMTKFVSTQYFFSFINWSVDFIKNFLFPIIIVLFIWGAFMWFHKLYTLQI